MLLRQNICSGSRLAPFRQVGLLHARSVFSRSSCSSRRHSTVIVRAADEAKVQFELAVPLSSPQGSQLAYILSHDEGNEHVLFEPAVKTYLQELQQERDAEAEMEAAVAADAAGSEAASSSSGGEGMDASETWDDAELMRRIRAVRESERGQIVADIVYLEAARQLQDKGCQLLANLALLSPGTSQPPEHFMSPEKLQQSGLLSAAVADAVVSYLASTFEGGDAALMKAATPVNTPLSVDRLQAARLYGGLLEFGYFSAALESECEKAGVAVGSDSSAMIAYADKLPEDELRLLCAVRSADGWWSAVRHIGSVFGLVPNEDPFDSFGLPYPDLALTISQIQMEPAANMWEHFNTPGTSARLAAKAADQKARGWSRQAADDTSLPDADLVSFEFGLFQRLLLEGAVYGAVLFRVEQRIEQQYGYKLSCRRERESHAGQPAM